MIRTFSQHEVRKVTELSGAWDLCTVTETGCGEIRKVFVPGCWESVRGLESYRGRCQYTKAVQTRGGNLRFVFYGVSHTADVYFDGVHVGHHYNAYTPFSVIVPNTAPGVHTLAVVADNSFSEESALHVPNDYRSYGGITRPVALEELPGAYIRKVHVTPLWENDAWAAKVNVEVCALDPAGTYFLKMTVAGQEMPVQPVSMQNGVCVLEMQVALPQCLSWSVEDPQMYFAQAALMDASGACVDDLIERFGLRRVEARGRKIYLNGKELFIKGFNRHEDYGTLGCAVPLQIMSMDLDLIRDMGANLVRCSHYPNDQRFLDLCDERGFLVWDEAHARRLNECMFRNPHFREQSAACIEEMVTNHYNHPSIIFWGILNECASDTEYGAECYRIQYEQLRGLDRSRLLTAATDRHYKDLALAYADVVSLNVYPLWYVKQDPLEYLQQIDQWVVTAGGADKPLLVSECGAAGVYGYRGFLDDKYSEDQQARILQELLQKLSAYEDLSGIIIWQYCDCRVDEDFESWAGRPKTQNNKGVVDIYRRPKMAYYTIRQCFEDMKRGE